MADVQEVAAKAIRFEELPKGANLNKLLGENQVVKLTPDDYKRGIQIKAGRGVNEEFGNVMGRDTIEVINREGKTLGEQVRINVDITPTVEGGYKVRNPHPQQEMSIWVYGEEIKIRPGDTVDVPAKPDKYKDLEGVESGTFSISAGTDLAIKVSRKPLSNEVSIKNFSIDKNSSQLEPQETKMSETPGKNIDLPGDVTFNFESKAYVRVDNLDPDNPVVYLRASENTTIFMRKEDGQSRTLTGDEIRLVAPTYFRVDNSVFYYHGLRKDGTPKITEIKK